MTGKIVSDGIDVVGAIDPSCQKKGIRLFVSEAASKKPGVAALVEAVLPIGTLHREVTATLRGTFHFRQGVVPDRILEVESVARLNIRAIH